MPFVLYLCPNSKTNLIVLFLLKRSYYTNAIYAYCRALKILVVIIPELLGNTHGQQRHASTGKSAHN